MLEVISENLLISQIKRGSCFLPEAKGQLRARKWDPVQNLASFPTASFHVTVGLAQQKSQPTAGGERLLASRIGLGTQDQPCFIPNNYLSLVTAQISP